MISGVVTLLLPLLIVTINPSRELQAPPPSASSHVQAAAEALRRGDADRAVAEAQAELRRDSKSVSGHELLGAALLAKRQWAQAEEALTRAKALEPKRGSTLVLLGHLSLATNKLSKATDHFQQALVHSPENGAARRGLATASLRRGNVRQALGTLEEGIRLTGDRDEETRLFLASLYYDLDRATEVERLLGGAPASLQARLLLGLARLEQGKRDAALTLLDEVSKEARDSLWGHLALGVAFRLRGQFREALAELEQVRKEQPNWAPIYVQEGEAWLVQRDLPRALEAYRKAAELALNRGAVTLRMARSLLAHGYQNEAARELERAVTAAPQAPEPLLALADLYRDTARADKAEALLRQAAKRLPREARFPYQLGLLFSQQRGQEAVAQFRVAARLAPTWPAPLMRLAEAYARQGEGRQALAAGEQAAKLLGETAAASLFLGTLHEQLQDLAGAEAAYRKALERETTSLPAALRLAVMVERQGRLEEARTLLERMGKADPTSPLPPFLLAQLHQRAGREADAIAGYRSVLRLDPDNVLALNNLAWLLGKDGYHLEEALPLAERAYQKAPGSAVVADTLGWLASHQGDLERAATLIRQAVGMNPDDPTIRYHLGAVLAKAGKKVEAVKELQRALATPDFPEAEAARGILQALGEDMQSFTETPHSRSQPRSSTELKTLKIQ